jgi:antirestriction protein
MAETPRVYVACLAAYNGGTLHGEWIDANQSVEELKSAIGAMLSRSPADGAEEWAFHDYEGFHGIEIDEHEPIEKVAELAAFIDEHGALGGALVGYLGDVEDAKRAFEEQQAGAASSLAEWAEEFLSECGDLASVPERLRPYIDFERYANDLDLSGDIFTVELDGTVHVFWTR